MRRLALLLLLLPLNAFAQGAGTPPFRGINNWNLIFGTDNTYDIGASGATRPRTGYFGTSVITPSLTVSGLTSGRVPFASTGGLLADDADLTFATDTLTATRVTVGTQLVIPAGAAAASSSLLFGNDTDTGIYSVSAGNVSVSTNGQERYRLTSSGDLQATASFTVGPIASADVSLRRVSAGVAAIHSTVAGTSARYLMGGGANVASATALPVPTGSLFHVTGTTTVTSITTTNLGTGTCFTMIFDGALTFTDGSNLKLAGDFVTTADDTLTVCFDGTNFYEVERSVN